MIFSRWVLQNPNNNKCNKSSQWWNLNNLNNNNKLTILVSECLLNHNSKNKLTNNNLSNSQQVVALIYLEWFKTQLIMMALNSSMSSSSSSRMTYLMISHFQEQTTLKTLTLVCQPNHSSSNKLTISSKCRQLLDKFTRHQSLQQGIVNQAGKKNKKCLIFSIE